MQRCHEWVAHLGAQLKPVTIGGPKIIFYGIVLVALASWLIVRASKYFKKPTDYPPRTPDVERRGSYFKAPSREPGGLYHLVTRTQPLTA
jgi:hypothetical protein